MALAATFPRRAGFYLQLCVGVFTIPADDVD